MSKAMTAASKEQLIELMQYLSQNISVPTIGIGGGFAPIGTIISYMGTTAPQDYLICDGTTYNIADYKQLSDFFAAQFGSANFFGGDGVTTFKVPDLRGEFLRGSGTNGHSGQGNGANVGVHQDGTVISQLAVNGNTITIYDDNSSSEWHTIHRSYDASISNNARTDINGTRQATSGSSVVGVGTTRPTNTSVLYCIKAVAAGDVYSTTERVVGTWIDGKKVYEKTVQTTFPSVVNTEKLVDIGASIDSVIDIKAIYTGDNYWNMLNNFNNSGQYFSKVYVRDNASSAIDSRNKIAIWTSHSDRLNETVYVTVRYTKTTD